MSQVLLSRRDYSIVLISLSSLPARPNSWMRSSNMPLPTMFCSWQSPQIPTYPILFSLSFLSASLWHFLSFSLVPIALPCNFQNLCRYPPWKTCISPMSDSPQVTMTALSPFQPVTCWMLWSFKIIFLLIIKKYSAYLILAFLTWNWTISPTDPKSCFLLQILLPSQFWTTSISLLRNSPPHVIFHLLKKYSKLFTFHFHMFPVSPRWSLLTMKCWGLYYDCLVYMVYYRCFLIWLWLRNHNCGDYYFFF